MNLIKQAFIEFFQAYKQQVIAMRRQWRKNKAINIADSECKRTGIPHYVLRNGHGDYEVLSLPEIETRLIALKKNSELPETVTMTDVEREAVYVTPQKSRDTDLFIQVKPLFHK
jgi:hypothetical protein